MYQRLLDMSKRHQTAHTQSAVALPKPSDSRSESDIVLSI